MVDVIDNKKGGYYKIAEYRLSLLEMNKTSQANLKNVFISSFICLCNLNRT